VIKLAMRNGFACVFSWWPSCESYPLLWNAFLVESMKRQTRLILFGLRRKCEGSRFISLVR
ncbi:hypothetical protein, partial [Serratia bockelmannii]|uniref:hypothetical protein n=1 Tax=Serratia bockelmannii TaxID=2703793 RepID=UPI003FA7AC2F